MYIKVEKQNKPIQGMFGRANAGMPKNVVMKPNASYNAPLFTRTPLGVVPANFETHHIVPIGEANHFINTGAWNYSQALANTIDGPGNKINLPIDPTIAAAAAGGLPYHREVVGGIHPLYSARVRHVITVNGYGGIPAVANANANLRPLITAHGAGNAINTMGAFNF